MKETAHRFHLAGDYAQAEPLYDQLLSQNHDNAGLLATMGTMYLQSQRYGLAISLLHRAAEKTPQSDILCNLGIAYKYTGQYNKAQEFMRRACERNPTAEAYANYSALFANTGEPEKLLELAKKGVKIDSRCALAHWNLAMAYLELGDWERAWDEQEWGFAAKMRVRRDINAKPYWNGTEGKTIAVYGEQGIGDEIMFASMIPELMAKNNVIFECHPRLKTLFEKSFPGLTIYGTRDLKEISWQLDHDIDYSMSIGSLGKWFRRTKESFPGTPYLKAESAPRSQKLRVGISWTGGMKQGRIRVREIPLAWWKSILDNDCEFVSLQYTECADAIKAVNNLGYDIKVMDEYVKAEDYYETAKLVQSCDLVISCCTSVIHLAGALGIPCWVMVPNKPAWRYGIKGPMSWYKSVRLYRQPAGGSERWREVVARVGYDLSEKVDAKRKAA